MSDAGWIPSSASSLSSSAAAHQGGENRLPVCKAKFTLHTELGAAMRWVAAIGGMVLTGRVAQYCAHLTYVRSVEGHTIYRQWWQICGLP